MAKRHETVSLTEADMRTAILEWLERKYGPAAFNLRLSCTKSSHGSGWAEVDTESYSATATREID